jgi:hypothetical protein
MTDSLQKSLKSALSSFMKELNFSAVAPELNDEESEEEEDEEADEEDDEDEDGDDDEDEDGDDDEDEDEEEDVEEDDEDAEDAEELEEDEEDEEEDDESEPEPVQAAAAVPAPEPEYVEPEFKKKSGLQGASGSVSTLATSIHILTARRISLLPPFGQSSLPPSLLKQTWRLFQLLPSTSSAIKLPSFWPT